MVEKDKKLKVIFKLLKKLSSCSKVGVFGVLLLFGGIFYKINFLLVVESEMLLKLSFKLFVFNVNVNSCVVIFFKKCKFKILVEGDVKDDLGGVCGVLSIIEIFFVFKVFLFFFVKKFFYKVVSNNFLFNIGYFYF